MKFAIPHASRALAVDLRDTAAVSDGFGERLRAALAAKGLTHIELAERIGSRPELISRWLKLDEAPRSKYVRKAADEIGIDPGWFVTGHGTPPSPTPTRAEVDDLRARVERIEKWAAETNMARGNALDKIRKIADGADADES